MKDGSTWNLNGTTQSGVLRVYDIRPEIFQFEFFAGTLEKTLFVGISETNR